MEISETSTALKASANLRPIPRGGSSGWRALSTSLGLAVMASVLLMITACGNGEADDEADVGTSGAGEAADADGGSEVGGSAGLRLVVRPGLRLVVRPGLSVWLII